jgi:hypothetical protein
MEIKTSINQVKSDILINQYKLQALINAKEPVNISDTARFKIDFTYISDSTALNNNPTLAILKQQIEISKREKQVEKLKLMPDLSIGYFNQSNKELNNNDRFTGIEVGVSIPILFFSQSSKIQAYKINEKIAQNNYEYYNTTLKSELQVLFQEYLKLKASIDYYENIALQQSEMIIYHSGKSYMAGNIDYVEYVLNLDKALEILRIKVKTEPIGFELLPGRFTLTQLQKLYEAIYGSAFDKRNFRKKVSQMPFVVPLKEKQKGVPHKPAQLFLFSREVFDKTRKERSVIMY